MTEFEQVREMCARANMRYSILAHEAGATIVINGSRRSRLGVKGTIELSFDRDGQLIDAEGRDA